MPGIFSIDPQQNRVFLPDTRLGEIHFTVTNGSSDELRGRVRTVPIGSCEHSWLSAEPETAAFAPGQAREFVVRLAIPASAADGPYSFRFDAATERNPDAEKTEGPTVAFVVPEGDVPPHRRWIWLVAALVLVAGGVVWRFHSTGDVTAIEGMWTASSEALALQRLQIVESDKEGGLYQVSGWADVNRKCPLFSHEVALESSGGSAILAWKEAREGKVGAEALNLGVAFQVRIDPLSGGAGEEESALPTLADVGWHLAITFQGEQPTHGLFSQPFEERGRYIRVPGRSGAQSDPPQISAEFRKVGDRNLGSLWGRNLEESRSRLSCLD